MWETQHQHKNYRPKLSSRLLSLLLATLLFAMPSFSCWAQVVSSDTGSTLIDQSMNSLQQVKQHLQQQNQIIEQCKQQIASSQVTIADLQAKLIVLTQQLLTSQGDSTQLKQQIASLQATLAQQQVDLKQQQDLLTAYQAQVEVISTKYQQLLTTSANLEKSLEVSKTLNYVLGGSMVLAILVIVGEALFAKK